MNGNRHRPDGTELLWKQLGVKGLQADPQLPFFIEWDVDPGLHPSTGATGKVSLECLEIAGDPARVSEWLGQSVDAPLEDVKVEWVAPNGTPGIVAAQVPDPQRARPHLSPGPILGAELGARARPRAGSDPEPEHLEPPRRSTRSRTARSTAPEPSRR